ncbi:hypothetical protein F4818DRAFT_441948 [Hypoxylon cercidicola]|nr:hypothetical protein F4818DRAFT_441948 [Hypoxylon cercidicola]
MNSEDDVTPGTRMLRYASPQSLNQLTESKQKNIRPQQRILQCICRSLRALYELGHNHIRGHVCLLRSSKHPRGLLLQPHRQPTFAASTSKADQQSTPVHLSTSEMARFFAALLAAAAMLQVGSAAPYPFTNGTAMAAPVTAKAVNTTIVSAEVLKRRLRDFPIALARP